MIIREFLILVVVITCHFKKMNYLFIFIYIKFYANLYQGKYNLNLFVMINFNFINLFLNHFYWQHFLNFIYNLFQAKIWLHFLAYHLYFLLSILIFHSSILLYTVSLHHLIIFIYQNYFSLHYAFWIFYRL